MCFVTYVPYKFVERSRFRAEFRVPIIIFIIIFLICQSIAYGLNIDDFKIYMSINTNNERGSSYSLASTVLPMILTFIINGIYQIHKSAPNE